LCVDAGTDVLGMKLKAEEASDKSHFVLNGRKMWITNGPIGGVFLGFTSFFLVFFLLIFFFFSLNIFKSCHFPTFQSINIILYVFVLVYARTGSKPMDLSMFIVESEFEGFSVGQHIKNKLG